MKEEREKEGEHGYSKFKGRRAWEEQQGRDEKSKEKREREEEYVYAKSKAREKECHSKMKGKREREEYEYGSTKSSTTREREEKYWKEKEKKVEKKIAVEKVRHVQQPPVAVPWVRENLRVRLISRTYKGGRHHKEKVQKVTGIDSYAQSPKYDY